MTQFTVVDKLDREHWDTFVHEHPKGSVFHSSYMIDVFRGTKNYHPLFLAALDKTGEILAMVVSICVQTLPGPLGNLSSRAIFYAEPLCREDIRGAEALEVLLAEHDAKVRKKALFAEVRPLCAAGTEKAALARCGYVYTDYLNFLADLRRSKDELWHMMSKSCRAVIRRSQNRGVEVRDATTEQGVEILYDILRLSYIQAKVPLADKSLFVKALALLQPQNMIKISVAHYRERAVAAGVILLFKKKIYAWYGGLDRENIKTIFPAECLVWHEMEWGRQQQYQLYDFGGAGWPDKPYGVREFKAKFGGELVSYGRYNKVYSPWKLALAEKAYGLGRRMVKPQNWKRL